MLKKNSRLVDNLEQFMETNFKNFKLKNFIGIYKFQENLFIVLYHILYSYCNDNNDDLSFFQITLQILKKHEVLEKSCISLPNICGGNVKSEKNVAPTGHNLENQGRSVRYWPERALFWKKGPPKFHPLSYSVPFPKGGSIVAKQGSVQLSSAICL